MDYNSIILEIKKQIEIAEQNNLQNSLKFIDFLDELNKLSVKW